MRLRLNRALATLKGSRSDLMMVAGGLSLAAGFFVLAVWAGLMVAGALLLVLGWTFGDSA